jgi:DNA-binding transcriptional regulator YiaG
MSELPTVTTNTALRAVRDGLRLSQDEFARAIREAGERLGEPNDCTKRLVQRWESGLVSTLLTITKFPSQGPAAIR